jgi:hypothetical protein
MRKLLATFVVLTIIVLVVAGCYPPTPAPQLPAQTAVCTALATLQTAVAKLDTVTADTTVAEVQIIQKEIDTAVEGVKTAVKAVPAAKVDAVTTAIDRFHAAVQGIQPADTLGEVSASITTAAKGVEIAIQAAQSTLSCK